VVAGGIIVIVAVASRVMRGGHGWASGTRGRPRSPRLAGRCFRRAKFASRRESRCAHSRPGAVLLHPPGDGGVH
jgi:hypothetical protein